MKPLVKKMITVVLCASTLTAPLFLTGCSVSKVANSVQQGVQKKSQDDVKVFNNYIKAVGDFNSHTVRFGYAIGPDIQKLREGQHLTSFMAPHFDSLQKNLQAAKDAGVPYDDMKEPLDNVLAVLKDIVPVASELDTYYQTNSYQADNYAKDQEFAEQGKENGVFLKRRQEQSLRWVRDMIDEHLHNLFFNNVVIQGRMGEVEAAVLDGEMSESQAVEELIGVFDKSIK